MHVLLYISHSNLTRPTNLTDTDVHTGVTTCMSCYISHSNLTRPPTQILLAPSDVHTGDTTCMSCGCVCEEHHIDMGQAKRSFEDKPDQGEHNKPSQTLSSPHAILITLPHTNHFTPYKQATTAPLPTLSCRTVGTPAPASANSNRRPPPLPTAINMYPHS